MSYLQQQIASLMRSAVIQEATEPYYEVLQYIELDGTQYFDTGVLGGADTKIEAGIFLTSMPSTTNSNYYIFGSRSASASANNIDCIWSWQLGVVCDFNNSAYASYRLSVAGSSLALNTVYDITINKDKRDVSLNGTSKGSNTTANTDTFNSTNTICIGIVNGANLENYANFAGGLTYFKINDDDYIPVLDAKMRPCLYNRTTKTFLYAKKIADDSPAYDLGFMRWFKFPVDYIQSSGTEYINTGYAFEDDFAYEVEYEGLNNGECLLGGRTSSVRTAILYRAMATQVDGQTTVPIAGLNATQTPFKLGVLSDTKHKIKVAIANNKGNVWVDDTQVYTNQSFTGTYISGKTTSIFADHFGDQTGTSEYQEYATSKLYALKFWQGTTLVRDYKPSVRVYKSGSDVVAKAFLYDNVYNKAYDNAGTGSFKAYIAPDKEVYNLAMHDTMDIDGFYLAEDGTKTVSSDGTSCYTEAIQVKEGDIIEWTVTAEAVTANKRIHGYSTNADITTGQKGSWVEMLAKIVFSTTSDTTQTATFVVPSGVNYIRLSHANVREFKDSVVRIRTYEVGKAIKYPQNNGFTLDAPNSSNFILDLLTRATTTSSYYMLDTRQQTGSSNEEEFGIGGSSSGSTVNWKCESETYLIKTNGTNWSRSSNYTYSHLLVGYKDGNTFKRTASFYDFNNQKTSDVEVVTALRDIADNTKPLTVLHTTSSNWLQNGAEINYFKYLQDGNDVWYDCIPVRNATVTSSVLLFDRVNNTSLPNTGSGTPTFVALD